MADKPSHVTPSGRRVGAGEDVELDPETDARVAEMIEQADRDIAERKKRGC